MERETQFKYINKNVYTIQNNGRSVLIEKLRWLCLTLNKIFAMVLFVFECSWCNFTDYAKEKLTRVKYIAISTCNVLS